MLYLSFLYFNFNFFSHNCFLFSQFFGNVEEAEWAAEVLKSTGKPTAITLCIGPHGDQKNVPAGECAVRLARAGTVKQSSVALSQVKLEMEQEGPLYERTRVVHMTQGCWPTKHAQSR